MFVTQWSTLFSLIIDKHAPIKSLRVSERYCPWVNEDLKKLIRIRDKFRRAAVKSNSLLLILKRQYFSETLAHAKGNMKES